MSRASSGRSDRWVRERVLRWTLRYTRGLPRRTAEDRLAEILSDLWEQAAAADVRGQGSLRLARSVAARAVAGMLADLRWRRAVLLAARRAAAAQPARARLPLAGAHLFDRTNGVLPAVEQGDGTESEDVTGLVAKAVASNAVNAGSFGGGPR